MDHLSPQERSDLMAKVRSTDTSPEILIRRALWREGFRYRLHDSGLPGSPDLVFSRLRTVVFVHGCLWHGHKCARGATPRTNVKYWRDKVNSNRKRDRRVTRKLRDQGWSVLTVWSCELRSKRRSERTLKRLLHLLAARALMLDNDDQEERGQV